jgi:hypothetical protein
MTSGRTSSETTPCCTPEGSTTSSCCGTPAETTATCCGDAAGSAVTAASAEVEPTPRALAVELLVIDLESCARCVPTGTQLREALERVTPAAEALGIALTYRETIVQSADEAKARALLSSPTIRFNGHDISQDIRESECESCGDLTENDTSVDCREWHYRGQVYSAAPVPFLVEELMDAMMKLDEIPAVQPDPLPELPANLQRYFDNKRTADSPSRCC